MCAYIVGFRLFKTFFKLQDQSFLQAGNAKAMVSSDKQLGWLKHPGGGTVIF
jgi:hypothetical protein